MRDKYNNGDELGLKHNGCDECAPLMINGVLCHEHGCPVEWKDKSRECVECGRFFYPESKPWPGCQDICHDCENDDEDDEYALYCDVMGADKEFLDYEE